MHVFYQFIPPEIDLFRYSQKESGSSDIRRFFIPDVQLSRMQKDMVEAFKRQDILLKRISVTLINERGEREEADDFGGLMRDLFCAFWAEFFSGFATG